MGCLNSHPKPKPEPLESAPTRPELPPTHNLSAPPNSFNPHSHPHPPADAQPPSDLKEQHINL